jgi:CRP/FNR family transcriptional regulator
MNDLKVRATAPASCAHCLARELCLPSQVEAREVVRLDGLIGYRRRLARGDVLFRAGQPFAMIHAVRFGHLKSSRPDHRGQPHVTAFHMTGDLLGLDAIAGARHACTAVALEDSEVCEIPYCRLQEALAVSPALMQRFHVALSREIQREQGVLLHADMKGPQRLASLLLELSERYAERGYSGRRFALRMSRADIGNYLGLTIETVSRLMTRFRDQGWIALDRREVELLDRAGLEALLGAAPSALEPAAAA